jgi:phospholipid/cholesterol/gamma-HCH transport system substrate-binding protein
MTENRKPLIRLGTFLTLGFAVLLAGLGLIGRKHNLFTDTFTVNAMFHNAGGLQVGNKVRYAGVDVGTVKGLVFQDARTIRVTLVVNRAIQKFLSTATVGTVSSDGLIGNKFLVLAEPETPGQPLRDQDSIQGFPPPNLDELFAQVNTSLNDFRQITGDMKVIAHRIRTGEGTVGKLFTDPKLASNVGRTMDNLEKGSSHFRELMEAAKHSWVLWGFGKNKDKDKDKPPVHGEDPTAPQP